MSQTNEKVNDFLINNNPPNSSYIQKSYSIETAVQANSNIDNVIQNSDIKNNDSNILSTSLEKKTVSKRNKKTTEEKNKTQKNRDKTNKKNDLTYLSILKETLNNQQEIENTNDNNITIPNNNDIKLNEDSVENNGENKESATKTKKEKKRKNKNDVTETEDCYICGLKYLSKTALVTHIKTKHQDDERAFNYLSKKRARGNKSKNNEENNIKETNDNKTSLPSISNTNTPNNINNTFQNCKSGNNFNTPFQFPGYSNLNLSLLPVISPLLNINNISACLPQNISPININPISNLYSNNISSSSPILNTSSSINTMNNVNNTSNNNYNLGNNNILDNNSNNPNNLNNYFCNTMLQYIANTMKFNSANALNNGISNSPISPLLLSNIPFNNTNTSNNINNLDWNLNLSRSLEKSKKKSSKGNSNTQNPIINNNNINITNNNTSINNDRNLFHLNNSNINESNNASSFIPIKERRESNTTRIDETKKTDNKESNNTNNTDDINDINDTNVINQITAETNDKNQKPKKERKKRETKNKETKSRKKKETSNQEDQIIQDSKICVENDKIIKANKNIEEKEVIEINKYLEVLSEKNSEHKEKKDKAIKKDKTTIRKKAKKPVLKFLTNKIEINEKDSVDDRKDPIKFITNNTEEKQIIDDMNELLATNEDRKNDNNTKHNFDRKEAMEEIKVDIDEIPASFRTYETKRLFDINRNDFFFNEEDHKKRNYYKSCEKEKLYQMTDIKCTYKKDTKQNEVEEINITENSNKKKKFANTNEEISQEDNNKSLIVNKNYKIIAYLKYMLIKDSEFDGFINNILNRESFSTLLKDIEEFSNIEDGDLNNYLVKRNCKNSNSNEKTSSIQDKEDIIGNINSVDTNNESTFPDINSIKTKLKERFLFLITEFIKNYSNKRNNITKFQYISSIKDKLIGIIKNASEENYLSMYVNKIFVTMYLFLSSLTNRISVEFFRRCVKYGVIMSFFWLKYSKLFDTYYKNNDLVGKDKIVIEDLIKTHSELIGKDEKSKYDFISNFPILSNTFINDFMHEEDFMQLKTEEELIEIIEIYRQFSIWLFENRYSDISLSYDIEDDVFLANKDTQIKNNYNKDKENNKDNIKDMCRDITNLDKTNDLKLVE